MTDEQDFEILEPVETEGVDAGARLIRELSELAADPRYLVDSGGNVRETVIVTPEGAQLHSFGGERWELRPFRKSGLAVFYSRDSLVEWIGQHDEHPRFYLDPERNKLVAVMNDDFADQPGWRDFGAELSWRPTEEWKAWLRIDGDFLTGQEMAEHVELWRHTIAAPDSATLADLVRQFKATRRSEFRSDISEHAGDQRLEFVQTTTAEGGAQVLTLPEQLSLVVEPFIGSDAQEVTAMFRYRANESTGKVTFGVRLVGPDQAEQEAINDDVLALEQLHETAVMVGRPAGSIRFNRD